MHHTVLLNWLFGRVLDPTQTARAKVGTVKSPDPLAFTFFSHKKHPGKRMGAPS